MKERIISLANAQQNLTHLSEEIAEENQAIIVTQNRQPIFTILPYETYQALLRADQPKSRTHLSLQQALINLKQLEASRCENQAAPSTQPQEKLDEFLKEFGW